jgi:prepilin-type N-terminal cleavage/methylation domain-containing protein
MMRKEGAKRKGGCGKREVRALWFARSSGSLPPAACRRLLTAFTLVELMAVIAIIGLMMLVAMPVLQIGQGSKLISAARQFSNDLSLARQYGIAKNWRMRVVVATARTISDSGTSSPVLLTMQYRAYAIMRQTRITGGWVGAVPNEKNLPPGMDRWYYVQDWKTLPNGVIFDPAQQDLKSADGKSTPLPMTTIFFDPNPVTGTSSHATQYLWDKVSLDSCLPFPYRTSDTDPPSGCEMAFIEFKPSGTPTMAGSVRLINGLVRLNVGASGGGGATVIVPGRTSATTANAASDPASLNCVVLSWDDLIGKIKWTQPGT